MSLTFPLISVEFRTYRRQFRQPLKTHHGIWRVREGIILRLTNAAGKVGWGEIAPIPWFGSETLTQAVGFCRSLAGKLTQEIIAAIPATLPACQFGFESAWEVLTDTGVQTPTDERLAYSYLLPAGEAALVVAKNYQERTTFKWKIGVAQPEAEMAIFAELMRVLPAGSKIRLDANGGLTLATAIAWLELSDRTGVVEFIEQPLPTTDFLQMLAWSQAYQTPIALDESVASLQQLEECYQRGWRGIFVIKPAIIGSPRRLRQFCTNYPVDLVFSSVFETNIGRAAALRLAAELAAGDRAVGFGVDSWFEEEDRNWLELLWQEF